MNEFDLIRHVRGLNPSLGSHVVLPPGDDLGGIQLSDNVVLAGVDQVIGGVHLPAGAEPERYARKVLRRSLSDVAAMAALPAGALVTAALPAGLPVDWGQRFADALNEEGGRHGCPVFGGDVAALPDPSATPVVTATVLANPDQQVDGRFIRRDQATPGDEVWVSGCFGGSLDSDGGGHHETFEPRIELALAIHRTVRGSLHSMIDVSDGLISDLGHLAEDSAACITIDLDRIPLRGDSSSMAALGDGEDYELCFTVAPSSELPGMLSGVPLSRIGVVSAGGGVVVTRNGAPISVDRTGWEHRT